MKVAIRLLAMAVAVVAMVLTRYPADTDAWSVIVAGMGLVVLILAGVAASGRGPVATAPAVFILTLCLMLIPSTDGAWWAMVPDWSVALTVVGGLHIFFASHLQDDEAPAAHAPQRARQSGRHLIAFWPVVFGTAALIAFPWVARWLLPPRMHAALEWHGAAAPLAVLTFLAALAAVVGLVRGARADRPVRVSTGGREEGSP